MSNSIKPARYRGCNLTAMASVAERYPMVHEGPGATWPTPEAKALYASDGHSNPRWCLTCFRAFEATRLRHAHRGIAGAAFDGPVVHGGPTSLYCSDGCSRRGRDRRYRNRAVWLECAGCGTAFCDWWQNAAGEADPRGRTTMPRHSCVPPWTPGEDRLYSLLPSPCLSDPVRAAKITALDRQVRADRKKASDHTRAGERTEKRATERAQERRDLVRLLLFIECYKRARTDAERLRERNAYDGVSEESAQAFVRLIPEAIRHLDACGWKSWPKTNEPHSKGQRRLHRYARLYRLAAEGRLAGYLDEERIQQARRAADEARLGGQR
jgi:hypothetical protein